MERAFQLTRGVIDLETGEFPVTLFTNGEASDGHIIDIAGLEVPERLPMFANHNPDPTQRMGGLHDPHKAGKTTRLGGASLKMRGVIDVNGDSAAADIRRDVAQGISVGDITAMSGRWDAVEAVPRASLAKTHYAFSEVASQAWDTPMFFANARALEGSIVGVGADAAALVGRARDTGRPEHVRRFYDVLVNGQPVDRSEAIAALALSNDEIRYMAAIVEPLPDEEPEIERIDVREHEDEDTSEAEPVTEPATEEREAEPVIVPASRAQALSAVDGVISPSLLARLQKMHADSEARIERRVNEVLVEGLGLVI